MPLLKRIRSGLKSFGAMIFSGRGPNRWTNRLLGATRFDYASEVRPDTNSIVMSTIGWICRTFPEAPLRVSTIKGTDLTPALDHPLTQLLRRPNPAYSGILLWMATLASWILTGNAYWLKVRSVSERVVQLWWAPSNTMTPHWPDDGSAFIDYYEYNPDGRSVPIRVEITEVVHFRYGLDPDNPRLGLSPLRSLVREIYTDDEAANFTAAILRNLGVPGVVISPDDDMRLEAGDADSIKSAFSSKFSGDRRGEPLVLDGKSKVQVLSFSPTEMDVKSIRRIPEERTTAVFGIAAVVVGLGAGLDRSTFANYSEAREAAYESNIIPTQRLFGEELRVQLLVDFADISRTEIDFDLSKVRVLQDDQNKLTERLTRSLAAGGMTLNTYLRGTGQDEIGPDGDVFYVPTNVTPTAPGELLAVPDMTAPVVDPIAVVPPVAAPSKELTNGHVRVEVSV